MKIQETPTNIKNLPFCSCSFTIALEVSRELPKPEEIKRWLGEPIRTVILPTKIFLTNKKGGVFIVIGPKSS